jgi:AsmA protein
MKALRIPGIVLGLVVVLLAAGVGLLHALFDGERIKGELSRAVLEQTRRTLDIPGPLELSVWPDVGIKLGRASLSEPGGKEEFLALDSARMAVAVMPLLSRQVQVKRIEIDGLKATLVKKRDGGTNITDLAGGGDAKEKVGAGETAPTPLRIDIAGIKLTNAQFTWRDEARGSTTVLSRIDLASRRVQADAARQTLGVENLTLAATLTGKDRSINARLELATLERNAQALKIARLALDLDGSVAQTSFKAHLDSPLTADLTAQTLALENLAGAIELADPKLPMKQLKLPLAGKLRADLARQTVALDLATQFDESKIASKVNVTRFAPLALGFDLDIDQLDVDRYLPPNPKEAVAEPAAKAAAQPPQSDPSVTEARLDFSVLKGLDVTGAIRVGALQVSKLKLTQLDARLALADGRLDIAPITLKLYQGAASGSATVNANGNSLALKQNLTGVSINPLLKDLAGKDLLEGRGSVAVDLGAHGDSVSALKKSLAGTASISLKEGAIKGINLAQRLREVKARLDPTDDTAQQARAGEKTDFSELSASVKIAGGVAHNDDLAMKSPFLRLSGAGDIDLGADRLNYVARVSVVGTSTGQGGKELGELQGLTVPVRITGPLAHPAYKFDFAGLVTNAAKVKIDEAKQELKAKAKEKVRDQLKGLFGGGGRN